MRSKLIIAFLLVLSLSGCVRYYNGFGEIAEEEEMFPMDDSGKVQMFFYDLKENITEKDYLFYIPQEGTNVYYGSFYFFNENDYDLELNIKSISFNDPTGNWNAETATEEDSLLYVLEANTGFGIPEDKQKFHDFDVNIPENVENVNLILAYDLNNKGNTKEYQKDFTIHIGNSKTILPWKAEK